MKSLQFHCVLFLVLVYGVSVGTAQVKRTTLPPTKTEQLKIREFQEQRLLEPARIVMGGPIDAETYLVGPGDELMVSIVATSPAIEFPLVILPEGGVNIPDIGDVSLDKLTLAESRKRIKEQLKSLYPDSNITITLANVRIFIVRLTGEVEEPGIRYANATWRVSDVLDQSGGLKKWANGSAIEVRHDDGSIEIFDSWKYYNYGRQSNNPLLRDGDEIFVPGRNFVKGTIHVQSSLNRSGFYQFLEGESVLEFIKRGNFDVDKALLTANRFGATRPDTDKNPIDLENISITRNNANGMSTTVSLSINPNGSNGKFIGDFILQPHDVLILPVLANYVFVDGEVTTTGEIEWVANRRASYYVGIAGRTSDAAKDDKIVIIRKNTNGKIVGENPIMFPGDHIFVPKRRILVVKEWFEFVAPFVSIIIAGAAIGLY